MSKPLLSARDLTVRFGGLTAVQRVNFDVRQCEVFTLIGPNGAGKTTVFNLISGIYTPTEGQLFFDGQAMANVAPHQIANLGIARTFQNIELFEHATVLQNLLIGCHARARSNVVAEMLFLPSVRRREVEHRLADVGGVGEPRRQLRHERRARVEGVDGRGDRRLVHADRARDVRPRRRDPDCDSGRRQCPLQGLDNRRRIARD